MKSYWQIVKLVWPLALGMVNNAVMQFVDRAYLANASVSALEAVLPATTLAWVFLSFCQAIVGYSGVFVAQYHGAKDADGCRRSYRAGLLSAGVSALLLLPMIPLGNAIFRLTARTDELVRLESAYYDITLGGAVFLLLQMAATAYFTGIGKTRIIFWVNLLGNLVNVALDPVLIYGWCGLPKLGVAGAALATVLSQFLQCVILLTAAHRAAPHANLTWRASLELLPRILRFGVPAAGYEVLNMLSFTIFVFVTGRFSALEFASSNVCFAINYLLFAPMLGFSLGAQTVVGQALGARDPHAASVNLKRTLHVGLGFLAVAYILVMIFSRPILQLFVPPDLTASEEFLSLCGRLMLVMSIWVFFDAADIILCGALKGAGDTKFVFWWMTLASFLIWLPIAGLVYWFGGSMVQLWLTMVVAVFIYIIGSWWRWRRGAWRHIGPVFSTPSGPA